MEKEDINKILDKYSLDEKDKEELRKIIFPIVNYINQKKRGYCTSDAILRALSICFSRFLIRVASLG